MGSILFLLIWECLIHYNTLALYSFIAGMLYEVKTQDWWKHLYIYIQGAAVRRILDHFYFLVIINILVINLLAIWRHEKSCAWTSVTIKPRVSAWSLDSIVFPRRDFVQRMCNSILNSSCLPLYFEQCFSLGIIRSTRQGVAALISVLWQVNFSPTVGGIQPLAFGLNSMLSGCVVPTGLEYTQTIPLHWLS